MTLVPAPQATVPLHSLIRSALTNRDGDTGWERGLAYAPEVCGGYRVAADCSAEEVDYGSTEPPADPVDYRPFDLYVQDPCASAFGYDAPEVTDRLRRAMDAVESFGIARELWTGDLTTADAAARAVSPNLSLTGSGPTLLSGTPVDPKRGLGMLEFAIGEALHGQQAYLHVSRTARPYFPELVKVGNLLYTNIDNVVVADAGYPGTPPDGTAPAAGVAWVYATGPVVVRRSTFDPGSVRDAEVIDARTNTVRRTASKRVAATFDPCALFAVPITLS